MYRKQSKSFLDDLEWNKLFSWKNFLLAMPNFISKYFLHSKLLETTLKFIGNDVSIIAFNILSINSAKKTEQNFEAFLSLLFNLVLRRRQKNSRKIFHREAKTGFCVYGKKMLEERGVFSYCCCCYELALLIFSLSSRNRLLA